MPFEESHFLYYKEEKVKFELRPFLLPVPIPFIYFSSEIHMDTFGVHRIFPEQLCSYSYIINHSISLLMKPSAEITQHSIFL